MILRSRGLARRTRDEHDHFLKLGRLWRAAAEPVSVFRPRAVLHDQLGKPSCLPQSYAQGIEPITGKRVSAVRWHEGARTLQGMANIADVGTRSAFVLGWADRHGWADYTPGEDARAEPFDTDGLVYDSIGEAMAASRRAHRLLLHQVIDTTASVDAIRRQIVAALNEPDTFVPLEGGTRGDFDHLEPNAIETGKNRGGDDHGHAELACGYDAKRDALLVKGSWGNWTWCTLPDGTIAQGCYWFALPAVRGLWAADAIRVVP